ncbi:MAG TPA: hypothetical protein VNM16_02285 [Bacillota bacterium]|nr:hypothetical protein [Bacillota bacterium]
MMTNHRRVMVPLDGSPLAEAALPAACRAGLQPVWCSSVAASLLPVPVVE